MNSQSNDKNDSQIKKSENESAQKKVSKLFSFIESNDKKEEKINFGVVNNNQSKKKNFDFGFNSNNNIIECK